MAIETVNMQILQKQAADEYLLLHPETDAELVLFTSSSITGVSTVSEALEELEREIQNATAGSVTGVKGSAEETYRIGNVELTAENIGLGNVDNTSDMDKPVSTATQAALDEKQDVLTFDEAPAEDSSNPVKSSGIYAADAALQANIDAEATARTSGDEALQGNIDSIEEESGAEIKMDIDDKTYIVTLGLYNKAGDLLGEEQTIDLPLESVVVGGSYDAEKKEIILELDNGDEVEIPVGDLVSGLVSESDFESAVGTLNANITAAIVTAEGYADTAVANGVTEAEGYADTEIAGLKTSLEAEIEAKADASDLTALETRVSTVEGDVETAKETAEAAEEAASGAKETAEKAQSDVADLQSGEVAAGKADKLSEAVKIALGGDVSGSADFDGSEDVTITATLSDTGVVEGTWSAVQVDTKGRVLAGAQVIEVGSEGQEEPSELLAAGGIFFKRV